MVSDFVSDSFQVGLSTGGAQANLGAGPVILSDLAGCVDLTNFSEVRLATRVLIAGVTGRLKLMYSVDNFGTYADLTTNYIDLSSATTQQTEWEAIPVGARTICAVQAAAYNGDGSEDPDLDIVMATFRR